MSITIPIALIKGDGIGIEVTNSAMEVLKAAQDATGGFALDYQEIQAGAEYFLKTGVDIEPGGEQKAGQADAIFLGAIGLPSIRYEDGTEISPHLRLRDIYGLYAGVRPVKSYPNTPRRLADPRGDYLDMVVLRESTEGLFYSAAVHGRSEVIGDDEVRETMRITRKTTEKLHRFGFKLAQKRKLRGGKGMLTCVDKANVFTSMAFFRKIYDEIAPEFPDIMTDYNYIDAQALDMVRRPWEFDVIVSENMFGDILSDLAGGIVGGMGLAACGEIGDDMGLFQPSHGSAPDIMGQDKANPLAAILSGALMLEYLAEKYQMTTIGNAAELVDKAINKGFSENRVRPIEIGGDMGTRGVTDEVIHLIEELSRPMK